MNADDVEYVVQTQCLRLGAIGRCMEVHAGTMDRYAIIRTARGLLEILEPDALRQTAPAERDTGTSRTA